MKTAFARYFRDVRLADFSRVYVFRETYKFCDERRSGKFPDLLLEKMVKEIRHWDESFLRSS
jgi:hypothetical protein